MTSNHNLDARNQVIAHIFGTRMRFFDECRWASNRQMVNRILFSDCEGATLLEKACLAVQGIRVIRHDDILDFRGRHTARGSSGSGLWIVRSNIMLEALFAGTDFSAGKWWSELMLLPSSTLSRQVVRIGKRTHRDCLWIRAHDLGFAVGAG